MKKIRFKESYILLLSVLFGMAAVILFTQKKEVVKTVKTNVHIDTLIPQGYVLTPIEISNKKSLKSLMGQYGLVDLYTTILSKQKTISIPVIKSIKIIQAPYDKEEFAVLLPEQQVDDLLKYEGPFKVVVKNPKKKRTQKFIRHKKLKKRQIIINEEES